MLKATSDGGEQRMRERQHYDEMINERDNQLLDLKERLMKRDFEVAQLQQKCQTQENQIANLKRERDRLLDVSQNLKVSISKLEKRQILESIKLTEGAEAGHSAPRPITKVNENTKLMNSSQVQRFMGTAGELGLGQMLSIDSRGKMPFNSHIKDPKDEIRHGSAVATVENETDKQMSQLFEEVNQMKAFMAQIKKGEVIGEIASNQDEKERERSITVNDSVKAQRLEDLKRQREVIHVSPKAAATSNSRFAFSEPVADAGLATP